MGSPHWCTCGQKIQVSYLPLISNTKFSYTTWSTYASDNKRHLPVTQAVEVYHDNVCSLCTSSGYPCRNTSAGFRMLLICWWLQKLNECVPMQIPWTVCKWSRCSIGLWQRVSCEKRFESCDQFWHMSISWLAEWALYLPFTLLPLCFTSMDHLSTAIENMSKLRVAERSPSWKGHQIDCC